MKSFAIVLACFCVAVCAASTAGIFYLWNKGQLSPERIADLRDVLSGNAPPAQTAAVASDVDLPQPSLDEILEARARKAAEFQGRDSELSAIKTLTQSWTTRLVAERQAFEKKQSDFQTQLTQLDAKLKSESMEQGRTVLGAMSPKAAVEHLMSLPLEENVALLKGLSEKNIAKILKEFKIEAQPAEPGSKAERAAKIFEALMRGNPQRALLEQELGQAPGTQAPAGPVTTIQDE